MAGRAVSVWGVMNVAATNLHKQVFGQQLQAFLLGTYLGREWLGHALNLFYAAKLTMRNSNPANVNDQKQESSGRRSRTCTGPRCR